MVKTCANCGRIIQNGDEVKLTVYVFYKEIPSVNKFAVSGIPHDYEMDTLCHADCGESECLG